MTLANFNFAIFDVATMIANTAEAMLKDAIGPDAQVLIIVGHGGVDGGVAYRFRGGAGTEDGVDRAYYLLTALAAFHRDKSSDISLESLQQQVANIYKLHEMHVAMGAVRKRGEEQ